MSDTINSPNEIASNLNRQSCVRALHQSRLPVILKVEAEKFIERNTLQDCGRIPPNCLKAFMIKTAQKMGLQRIIPYVKNMFKSRIGYNGYYLDCGKLFRVDLSDDIRNLT
ncbi:hypothetical protein FJZ21_03790 [Candidatus Pacearchaeota archaeon]|nr:hypothetical protein [Candidatus Pacearchaeota archaeon]